MYYVYDNPTYEVANTLICILYLAICLPAFVNLFAGLSFYTHLFYYCIVHRPLDVFLSNAHKMRSTVPKPVVTVFLLLSAILFISVIIK